MLYDAHCHPTDDPATLPAIARMDATLCIMGTFQDLDLVAQTAREYSNVVPAFGLHPWYTHLFSFVESKQEHYTQVFGTVENIDELPDPMPLDAHLRAIEARLDEFPQAMVGEIGLDKAFKVKINGEITGYKTSMAHQVRVFEAQLELAARYNRAASVHGVQCHLPLLDSCTKIAKASPHSGMRICLHSFGGTPDFASQRWTKLKIPVYFSVATLINGKNRDKAINLVKSIPSDRILSESDYHAAGEYMWELLNDSLQLIQEGGVESTQVEANFKRFMDW